jgi:hypothetical protein
VRELEASADPKAKFALDYFAYRVGLYAGMLAAALGGVDGFVFTAGIGENSPTMRARIAERLFWIGGVLDPAANAGGTLRISAPGSRLAIHIVPTDEELMIARHTVTLLSAQRHPCPMARARLDRNSGKSPSERGEIALYTLIHISGHGRIRIGETPHPQLPTLPMAARAGKLRVHCERAECKMSRARSLARWRAGLRLEARNGKPRG